MKTRLLLLVLFPVMIFAQNRPMTYAEANPGVLHVTIDVSSDTAHLKSLIGRFNKNDIEKLKVFFTSAEAKDLENQPPDLLAGHVKEVETMLSKLLNRKVNPCNMMASDTSYAIFNSQLENEVIRPLIIWVKKNYYMCQMVRRVYGFDEAKRKLALRNKEDK